MKNTSYLVLATVLALATPAFAYTSGGIRANGGNPIDANGVPSHKAPLAYDYPRWDKGYREQRVILHAPNGCPFDGTPYAKTGITKQALGFQATAGAGGYVLNASGACKHPSWPNR